MKRTLACLIVIVTVAAPGRAAAPDVLTNTIGMKFKLIPAGEFVMGSPDTDKDAKNDEKPQHRVKISQPFYLGIHEVTRGQFLRFADETKYKTEAEKDPAGYWGWNDVTGKFENRDRKRTWRYTAFEQTDEHPVADVSWKDATAFAAWLSRKEKREYRLPTEAQWEYACRAGSTTRYTFGDDPEGLAAVANVADGTLKTKISYRDDTITERDGFVFTAPVGRYRPNAWGLYDMYGNVSEWCADGYSYDYYRKSPAVDPPGVADAPGRVVRGGSWVDGPASCRSAWRDGSAPRRRYDERGFLGFRLVLVPPSP